VIIPRLTITQPTTPDIEATNVGKLTINITGDFFEKMRLVCLQLVKGRLLWPADYSRDNEPLCKSNDFMVPVRTEGREPMCHSCGIIPGTKDEHYCEYANWGKDKKGKITAPRCLEVWNMLVFDLNTYMPMYLSLKSTSIKPLRKLFSSISILGNAKKVPMWGWEFEVSLKLEHYEKGKAYVPVFSPPKQVSTDDFSVIPGIRAQLAGIDLVTEDMQDAPPQAAPTSEPTEEDRF